MQMRAVGASWSGAFGVTRSFLSSSPGSSSPGLAAAPLFAQSGGAFHRVLDDLDVLFEAHGLVVALEERAAALGGAVSGTDSRDVEHVDDQSAAFVGMEFEEYGGHASSPRASSSGLTTTRSRWPMRSTGTPPSEPRRASW